MKNNVKNLWKTKKKWIIGITAGVAAAAIGCTAWYQSGHSSKEPVYVFPFQYVGMTEYWGDSQESYGPVSTDKIQTVFLTDTQTVTEILVQAGDTVKKGDLLMTFDTTLSDLQLERKRLDVEKLKLQLEDAKDELREINSMKPMVIPSTSPDDSDKDQGTMLTEPYRISSQKTYDGSSAEKALICWLRDDTDIDDSVFAAIHVKAEQYQTENQPEPTQPSEDSTDPTDESTEPTGDPTDPTDESTEPTGDPTDPTDESTEPTGDPTDSTDESTAPTEEPTDPTEESTDPTEESTEPIEESSEPTEETAGLLSLLRQRVPSSASAVTPVQADSFHVVFKVTSGNMSLGSKQLWQGMKVTKTETGYSFRFEDAAIPDHMMVDLGSDDIAVETPDVDFGSGYTAAQIAQLRSDQLKKIKDLEFQIKMAEAEYKIMLTEVSDGNVYSDIDGKVVSLLTEEEAKQTMQPLLKVSGGGGFYVEGFVSELEKETMKIGQEVTVNDWNTGMTYTGTVESMGDFPTNSGYYNGNGNPNASYYPFQVFVDESADLQAGSYVSVMYSAAESQNGVYLENPFLRTEKGKSYVYVLGEGGKLERRDVTTGKSLWGNYTEILEGLTADDLIAFPYGKNVKPGVNAEEGDMSDLYG